MVVPAPGLVFCLLVVTPHATALQSAATPLCHRHSANARALVAQCHRRAFAPFMAEQEELELEDDLFAIVGVSPEAAPDEIRRAFHKQARRLHPDCNPGPEASQEFRRLVTAFETVSNPQKRSTWEKMRATQARRPRSQAVRRRRPSESASSTASSMPFTDPFRAAPIAEDPCITVPGGSLRTWSWS